MTKIEWTDRTWNPVVGCRKVSEGCRNCYAEKMAWRLRNMPNTSDIYSKIVDENGWIGHAPKSPDDPVWYLPIRARTPKKIFVCSMSDLFDPVFISSNPEELFRVLLTAYSSDSRNVFQFLTKHPNAMGSTFAALNRDYLCEPLDHPVPVNFWLGTTVESTKYKPRIVSLREIKSRVRFVSFEPLLGPVGQLDLNGIHQVIVGGETGPGARPMKPEWVDEIFDQAKAQGVAFFFKQWGEYDADGQKVGRKKAGRLYLGRTWDEMPGGAT